MTDKELTKEPVFKCRNCGNQVSILYQQNTCKPCLVGSFQQLRTVIDFHRSREKQVSESAAS